MFAYEKWEVYGHLMRLVEIGNELRRKKPRRLREKDIDNFCRAAGSAVATLGEGAGRRKPKEKIHFYELCAGSISEMNASARELLVIVPNHPLLLEACDEATIAAAQMANLIRSIENRPDQP